LLLNANDKIVISLFVESKILIVPMFTKIIANYSFNHEDLFATQIATNPDQLILHHGNQNTFPDELSYFYPFLSKLEISRSKRFRKKSDERTYVITHALVNKKISEILGTDFNKLSINYFDNKKPYVEKSNLDFNLSHSSDCFAFAISGYENVFVGVDIEVLREDLGIEPIINNYFHKNEISFVLNSELKTQHQKFYEVWTRKEAFLKMIGTGLSEKLSELDMTPGEREIIIQDNNSFENHYFSNSYVYTLNLLGNLVLSLSTNRPVSIIPEHCDKF
jgi:4'-phosphopantetheinyl transferase